MIMKRFHILSMMLIFIAVMILLAACGEPNRVPLTPTATSAAAASPTLTMTMTLPAPTPTGK